MKYYAATKRGERVTVNAATDACVYFCDEPQVFLVYDGMLEMTVNGKKAHVRGGQAYIADSKAVTVVRVQADTNAVCVRFPLVFMQKFFAHTKGKTFAEKAVDDPELFALLGKLIDVFCADAEHNAFFDESFTGVFWGVLAARCPMRDRVASPAADCIRAALDYIAKHYAESLSLESLSALYGYSPYHFSRLFHIYTGVRLIRYINDVRLDVAARLLRDGVSVAAAARACGMGGVRSFYREFTARYGRSPQQYARSAEKEKS